MHQDTIGTVMITQEEINAKAAEIGQQIEKDFAGEEVVLIGILRGAVLWMGDIMKNVNLDMVIDFHGSQQLWCINKIFRCRKDQQGSGYQYQWQKRYHRRGYRGFGHHSQLSESVSAESRCQVCEDLYAS